MSVWDFWFLEKTQDKPQIMPQEVVDSANTMIQSAKPPKIERGYQFVCYCPTCVLVRRLSS